MPESTTNPRLIDGREIARLIEQAATAAADSLASRGIRPTLAVVYRGDHADAASYRRTIEQRAARVGVALRATALPGDASLEMLGETIAALNADREVHGALIQNPLPADQRRLVSERLAAHKDAEGLTAVNLGKLMLDEAPVLPCTPAAIAALIESRVADVKGKRVVVINRSATVGRPLSQILLSKRATVTVCSTATVDLPAEARRAEILVVAIGRPRAIGPEYIGDGSVVIDVGINQDPNGAGICGDVDTEAVLERVGAITPVPGGVGPVTTAVLIQNTVKLALLQVGS
jgi:methylenetetrahydrofolate dehydrogenase (NADP+)/methenyltetrahydrofolate cyclohydrolase